MSRCAACDRLLSDSDNTKFCYPCQKVSNKTTIDNDYDGSDTHLEELDVILENAIDYQE